MRALVALATTTALLAAAGCGDGAGGDGDRTLRVFAAASLAVPFGEIGDAYERAHPGTQVELNAGGTPQLLTQIEHGAPADVLVSADQVNMDRALGRGLVVGPAVVVARNRLTIVVRRGNPRRLRTLADLARDGVLVALAAEAVPAGRYALQALARAGVEVRPVTLEISVSGVVGKVALGEVDAGIVYRTDVRPGQGDVEVVPIPDEHNVEATYPMARASRSPEPAAAVVAAAFVALPLAGLLWRVPWSEAGDVLGSPAARTSLWLSLVCSFSATALSLVLGVPMAWVLARGRFRGRAALRALAALPMVLPPVVGGVALLYALGRGSPLGGLLEDAGVRLPFTTAGVVVAETFVAMPFLVLVTEAALRTVDVRLEEAAATLGAGRWLTFRRVTLPLVAPSVGAGAVLAWARALGEFGATVTFAGSFGGRTQTLPLAVFQALESADDDTALVLSAVLLAVSGLVLVTVGGRWYRS